MPDLCQHCEVMIPVESQKRIRKTCLRLPWYSLCICIIYIAIYFSYPPYSPMFNNLNFDTEFPREAYRWYTYSLLHLGAAHISTNIMMTMICGALIEWDSYALRCFLIHTLSIIGGGFGCGWESRSKHKLIAMVGASGGAYGLLASQMGNLIINWPELDLLRRIVFTSLLVCTTVSDIVVTIIMYDPMVSYSTHIGGFIAGAIAGGCIMKNWKKVNWERYYRIGCWVALGAYLAAGMTNMLVGNF